MTVGCSAVDRIRIITFQSTRPRRGAIPVYGQLSIRVLPCVFQSTRPRRGAIWNVFAPDLSAPYQVSIHAPPEGRDSFDKSRHKAE